MTNEADETFQGFLFRNPIEFIVSRSKPAKALRAGNLLDADRLKLEAEIRDLEASLQKLSQTELSKRYAAERRQFVQEDQIELEALPVMRPEFEADFEIWGRYQEWTLDQAVALYLGRDPDHFDWAAVEPLASLSERLREARGLRRMAQAAINKGPLTERNAPAEFIEWAASYGFEFPDALVEAVGRETEEGGVTPRARSFWEELHSKQRDNIARLALALAIDGYGFNPFGPAHGSKRMSAAMKSVFGMGGHVTVRTLLNKIAHEFVRDEERVKRHVAKKAAEGNGS